jgi:hypothetical protein
MRMRRKHTNTGTCERCVERLENTEARGISSNCNDEQPQHISDDDEEGFVEDELVFLSQELTESRTNKAVKALKVKLAEDEGSYVHSRVREKFEVLEDERMRLRFAKKPRRFKVDATGKKRGSLGGLRGGLRSRVMGGRTKIRAVECG